MKLTLVMVLVVFLGACPAWAGPELFGKVAKVTDGDTITIVDSETRKKVKVRLYGLDTPERNQPHGYQATGVLKSLVEGQEVTVEVMDVDRYGRTVGRVSVAGKDVAFTLLGSGLAWVYPQYCKEAVCDQYQAAANSAKEDDLGMWSAPTPPWEWRKNKR